MAKAKSRLGDTSFLKEKGLGNLIKEKDSKKPEKRKTVKAEKRSSVTPQLRKNEIAELSSKMTVLLKGDLYFAWKEYELDQVKKGDKKSFQKVVEAQLRELFKDYLKK